MKRNPSQYTIFQKRIRRWFKAHQRDLPWRKTRNPYQITVSEFMLQQTQVDRVIPKYRSFLHTFPNWATLANAPLHSVFKEWSGLGYNRRAKHLHQLAQIVQQEWNGVLPKSISQLQQLPGIGPYTARAIAVFAFGAHEAPRDTNIERVTRRYFYGERAVLKTTLEDAAQNALPARDAYWWNHALMDFGALVCTARRPSCMTCPLRSTCKAAPHFLRGNSATVSKRPQESFGRSLRQLRGLLVKELVQLGPQQRNQLIHAVLRQTTQNKERILRALQDLTQEGIVRAKGGIVEIA
ncbi:MAG: A/G-specific adenine glycosylase [Patescibacteria group bacterium]|jgi:A/G-specific adenine glycosylase